MKKIIAVLLSVCVMGAVVGCSDGNKSEVVEYFESKTSAKETDVMSAAAFHLDGAGVSKESLRTVLENNGFTSEEIDYAMENCGADWYEQAKMCATEYMEYMSFSYKGLVVQLKFEGFTDEEAEFGAAELYGGTSDPENEAYKAIENENALEQAKELLEDEGYSHSRLIKELEEKSYSNDASTYAADNCGADWNEEAVERGNQFIPFLESKTKSELIEQLQHDGFTYEEALYSATEKGF